MRFDAHKYWEDRHRHLGDSIRSTGVQSFGTRAARQMYDVLRACYEQVLGRLDLDFQGIRVLDAGAGRGDWARFLRDRGAQVVACDVSETAVSGLRERGFDAHCTSLARAPRLFDPVSFGLVQCIDVLYHITDDKEWRASVETLARLSSRYIVIHHCRSESPLQFTLKHIDLRTTPVLVSALRDSGFREIFSEPTHAILNALTLPLFGFIPSILHRLDARWVRHCEPRGRRVPSHELKVFERIS